MTHGYHSYNICVCTVWWCNNCTALKTPKKAARKNKEGEGGRKTFEKVTLLVHSILLSFLPVPPNRRQSATTLCESAPFMYSVALHKEMYNN